jgi:hypothetical protein
LSYKGIQAYWPNSESAAASRSDFRCLGPPLQPAHQIGEGCDRHEKADPCEAEFDGAKIGFVGRAVMMIKHGHWTAPALDARILIPFPYTENGHSILQRTNRQRLDRTASAGTVSAARKIAESACLEFWPDPIIFAVQQSFRRR